MHAPVDSTDNLTAPGSPKDQVLSNLLFALVPR